MAGQTVRMEPIGRPQRRSGTRPSVRLPGVRHPPRIVGRYLLCDAFAAGGMATVHLARLMGPEGFSRMVAIKQLHPQFAHDPKFVAMFLDEARLASRVRHPNVVSPLDVIAEPPDLFMVMDYVHGEPLSWLLKRRPEPVPPRIAAAIVGQALLGLHAAHVATGESGEALDLVHRDVSPHNILVTEDGVAKVVDFGIAKAKARTQQTERGMLKGKLCYMAPEQLNTDAVDRRADVFGAGVVLWELLTGRRLFNWENPRDALAHVGQPIPRPSSVVPGASADLDDVVMLALGWSPDERFDNARAMAQALDHSTPVASMLELAAWVESRVGKELSSRAELVAEIESLSFDDFTRSVRHPFAPVGPLAALPADLGEPGSAGAAPRPREEATARARRRWLVPLLIGAGLLLAMAAWALFRATTVRAPRPTVVAIPAPAVDPVAPEPRALELHAPEPSLPASSAQASSVPTPGAPAPSAAVPNAPKPSAPARGSVLNAPAPSATAPRRSEPVKTPPSGFCDVPYTVDKNGVKRFKEACF